MFLSSPGDLLTRALSWFSSENDGQGEHPVNVRRIGVRHNIVNSRQTDFGFGADARASPGNPSNPDLPLPIRSSPHDLFHAWDLLWWLPANVVLFSMWEHTQACLVAQACGTGNSKRIKLSHPSYSPDTQYMCSAHSTISDVSNWKTL